MARRRVGRRVGPAAPGETVAVSEVRERAGKVPCALGRLTEGGKEPREAFRVGAVEMLAITRILVRMPDRKAAAISPMSASPQSAKTSARPACRPLSSALAVVPGASGVAISASAPEGDRAQAPDRPEPCREEERPEGQCVAAADVAPAHACDQCRP